MKKWYKPVVQEIFVQDLIKEIAVNARSGGGGTGENTCIFFAGCDYGLNCDKVFIM